MGLGLKSCSWDLEEAGTAGSVSEHVTGKLVVARARVGHGLVLQRTRRKAGLKKIVKGDGVESGGKREAESKN